MNKNSEKGFSLIELFAVILIVAVIAMIAIPNLLASRVSANEKSAISSLRTIHSAEVTYFGTTGGNSAYTDLTGLAAQALIDSTLGSGQKSGYNFAISVIAGNYCASAVPINPSGSGATGTRHFAVGKDGVIHQIASAGACASGTLNTGGATPIQ